MDTVPRKKTLGLIETQPATVEGVKSLLGANGVMEFRWAVSNLLLGVQLLKQDPVDILLVDKAVGLDGVLDILEQSRTFEFSISCIVWSTSVSEPEALRLLQAGARGILRKTADLGTIAACFRTIAGGGAWMEDCVFRESLRSEAVTRGDLTTRERQVLELVEQGLKNKDIAFELGIRPGTVKIHLKHIFEKTGVRGRYGLALNGLRRRGVVGVRNEPDYGLHC
jgi:two-component system nitrate/nitrite response regulator NarL